MYYSIHVFKTKQQHDLVYTLYMSETKGFAQFLGVIRTHLTIQYL